jgi:hypothetical protein
MINSSVKVLLGVFVAMSVTSSMQAASTGVEADSWIANGTVTDNGEYITVSFRKQSLARVPDSAVANLDADETVAASAFVGSYPDAGIKGVSFRLMVESTAAEMPAGVSMFIIGGADDNRWTLSNLEINNESGVWVANNVTITADRGAWDRDMARGHDAEKQALRLETINDVKLIGFSFSQQGIDAQSYSIGDFRLLGDGFVSDPAVLHRLQDHLNQQISNTDQLTGEQLAQDSDGDGVSDYDAIMAGDDPGLAVKILEVAEDGITLEWPKAANRNYTLVRSSSLTDGFTEVVISGMPSSERGNMTYKDTTATGDVPYFYRVIKKEN